MKLWDKPRERQFVCFFNFLGLHQISLGISVDLTSPNIEIHVPFGFLKIGWSGVWSRSTSPVRLVGKRWHAK